MDIAPPSGAGELWGKPRIVDALVGALSAAVSTESRMTTKQQSGIGDHSAAAT